MWTTWFRASCEQCGFRQSRRSRERSRGEAHQTRDGIMALFGNTGGFWRRRLLKLVLLFGRAMMMFMRA